MLAAVFACDKFKPYIVGSKVIVHTDHQALKYLLTKKIKPRLIRWILLLQEYNLRIIDRKGKDNHVAYHLSQMEGIPKVPIHIYESFLGEHLAIIKVNQPWFADYANFLAWKFLPKNMKYQQRKKFFNDLKHYFWDDPYLY